MNKLENYTMFDYLTTKISNTHFKINTIYTLTLKYNPSYYNKPNYNTIGVSVKRTGDDEYTFYIEYGEKIEFYQCIRLYYKNDVAYIISELFKRYHNVDLSTIDTIDLTN